MAEALVVSRLIQFAAAIVVFGCGAFRFYGLGIDTATITASALAAFDSWFWRVTTVGARRPAIGAEPDVRDHRQYGRIGRCSARSRYDRQSAVRHSFRTGVVLAPLVCRPHNRRLPCDKPALEDARDPRRRIVAPSPPGLGGACRGGSRGNEARP